MVVCVPEATYSSERGVIFFSSISSSANSFLYFSQLDPVADGCTKSQYQIYAAHGAAAFEKELY